MVVSVEPQQIEQSFPNLLSPPLLCLPQRRHPRTPRNFTLLQTLTHRPKPTPIALCTAHQIPTAIVPDPEARQVTIAEAVAEEMALDDARETLRDDFPGCCGSGGGVGRSGVHEIAVCGEDGGGCEGSKEEGC
jgi:hypothetical protein